jgi:carboxymethylenebutenolidase
MPRLEVSIKTRDGVCPASLFTPANVTAPLPGVMFFMDGLGIRPVMWDMGQQLADAGYVVLLPDLYYRMGSYAPMDPSKVLADPASMQTLMTYIGSLDRDRKISDAEAFFDFFATRPEVKGNRFGATGYCMGGNIALTVAGALPDRLAASASFHGGNLASDKPDSPHRFAKNITARIYVAGAIEDTHFTDEQKQLLEASLTDAHVDHVVETYAGAHHGFAVPDVPAYNAAAAKRHWDALLKLLKETLPA